MKLIRLATVAVLTSTIFAGGVQAFATSNSEPVLSHDTENNVQFTAGEEEIDDIENPIDQPPVIIPPITGAKGPLTIAYAPATFDFGTHAITSSDARHSLIAQEFEIDPEAETDLEGFVPYVSLVQVSDTRGQAEADWTLSFSLSPFIAENSNDVLTGAYLEFKSPQVTHNKLDNSPDAPIAQLTNQDEQLVVLPATNTSIDILTAGNEQGQGRSTIFWGDQDDLLAQYHELNGAEGEILNDRIELVLPVSAAPNADKYTATLTWNLSSTVGVDGENEPDENDEEDENDEDYIEENDEV